MFILCVNKLTLIRQCDIMKGRYKQTGVLDIGKTDIHIKKQNITNKFYRINQPEGGRLRQGPVCEKGLGKQYA